MCQISKALVSNCIILPTDGILVETEWGIPGYLILGRLFSGSASFLDVVSKMDSVIWSSPGGKFSIGGEGRGHHGDKWWWKETTSGVEHIIQYTNEVL